MKRHLNFFLVLGIALLALTATMRARVVFIDRFEYAVGRNDANAVDLFRTHGGWSYAKTQQSSDRAHGYLHTVTSIPGYNGPFPGTNSSRVLLIEALPGTLNGQTDFYLELGSGETAPDDFIPGDVWIQFWMYPQNYGNQRSRFGTRAKFLYMCNTAYPCHSHLWMLSTGPATFNNNMFPLGNPSQGDFYFNVSAAAGQSNIVNTTGDPYSQDTMGVSNASAAMRQNRWTLVKMHFNTTRTSGNSWEMWLRPYGGQWTKAAEWIGGSTPGFSWNIPAGSVGGHRVLRMPTTVGGVSSQLYDYWLYMDDFAMATSEDDLPVYPDAVNSTPRAPSNLRIIGAAFFNMLGIDSPAEFWRRTVQMSDDSVTSN